MESGTMKNSLGMPVARVLALAALCLGGGAPAIAHDLGTIAHEHVYRQTAYGTLRQGHSVNNELGSIVIWSPRPYVPPNGAIGVRFIQPQPLQAAPGASMKMPGGAAAARNYGKPKAPGFGNR
jgi:hypothetical protein